MLLVRRLWLILLAFVSPAAILSLGGAGYALLRSADRFQAERLLFGAVSASAVVLLLLILIGRSSASVRRILVRLTQQVRRGGASLEHGLGRLGSLGRQIGDLTAGLRESNRSSSLKLSAQARLVDFLLDNVGLALLVVDASGIIVGASRAFRPEGNGRIAGQTVDTVLEGFDFRAAYGRLERERALLTLEDSDLRILPIVNRAGEVDTVVVVRGKGELRGTGAQPAPVQRRPRLLERLLSRRSR